MPLILIFKDFYCNKGIWKCLMLKGIDITNYKPEKCNDFRDDDDSRRINQNIEPRRLF